MTSTKPSCRGCQFHAPLALLGGTLHLCTLPPDCAPMRATRDEDADRSAREESLRTYVGTSCHVMRRPGALCGPHSAMWRCAATGTEGEA
jgi:hypothetical protein